MGVFKLSVELLCVAHIQGNCCAGIKKRHPQLWVELKMDLHKNEQLSIYLDVMASADEAWLPSNNANS